MKTPPSGVLLVVKPVVPTIAAMKGEVSRPFAPSAVKSAKCPSNRREIALFIAGSVFRK